MRVGKIRIKRRVLVGLVIGFLATGSWWMWSRSRIEGAVASSVPKRPFVRLASSGGAANLVLRERADYFDPTPLFFPTEWNFGQNELPGNLRRQPGQVFGSFDAKFTFSDQKIRPYGADSTAGPEQMADVLNQGDEAPFAGMGQNDVQRSNLTERSGFLEVRSMANGNIVTTQQLTGITLMQADLAPLEFMAVVGAAGLVSEPILVAGSGRDEVDAFLRTYLVKTFHLGERMSPGLYRVLIGP